MYQSKTVHLHDCVQLRPRYVTNATGMHVTCFDFKQHYSYNFEHVFCLNVNTQRLASYYKTSTISVCALPYQVNVDNYEADNIHVSSKGDHHMTDQNRKENIVRPCFSVELLFLVIFFLTMYSAHLFIACYQHQAICFPTAL